MENYNRCPNCGGKMDLSRNKRSMICPYCDSEFLLNQPAVAPQAEAAQGAAILDDNLYDVRWDYDYLSHYNKDVSESLNSLIYCANELVTSGEILNYMRRNLLNDSELAGEGVNEGLLSELKVRFSGIFLPDEKIVAYGNTGVFSNGKEGMVITNKRTIFAGKKKHKELMHKDIHSVRMEIGMKLPSYYLNGSLDYYLMSMGSHFKLQGAMMALVLAYAWEQDPKRERIEIESK